VTTFTLYQATLELSMAVVAADRAHQLRPSLFLRAGDEGLEGWSEVPAAVDPGVDPSADELVDATVRLLDGGAAQGTAARIARGLLDAALLDLGLRHEHQSLSAALGVTASDVGFSGVVGIQEPGLALDRAQQLVALGASRLRVKVSPEAGFSALSSVLDAVDVPVVADANGSFEPAEHQHGIEELCSLPLAWLEQPFAPDRLEDTALLARSSTVQIGLDESATSLSAIQEAGRLGAAHVICVKPMRFGIQGALEARREAARLGMRSYVGGYFEAGLGRAVLAALAALDTDLDGDVAAPCTYLVADPCALAGPIAGRQPLHVTPGCGPVPDTAGMVVRLERVASERPGRRS